MSFALFIIMDKNLIKIEGERIILRILTEKDATEKYCSWINDPDINEYLDSKSITKNELKQYINIRYNDPNCLFFGIFLKQNDIHIGNVKLEPIDFQSGIATLGILIGEKNYWSNKFATETLKTLITYAFNNLNLNQINLGVYKENIAAIKAYKKSGFKIYEEDEKSYKLKVVKKIW